MKPNTLHYTFKEPIVRQKKTEDRPRLITCMSMCCTSFEGARRILGKRNKENIKKAIFTNKYGTTEKLKV